LARQRPQILFDAGATDVGIRVGDAVDEVASSQWGLITSDQAISILGASRKARWIRAGQLIPTQPRVYRTVGAPPTWHQQVAAAALSADGIVSHRSAASLWGLLRPTDVVEVSVAGSRRPRLSPPAIVHRIHDLHPSLAVERMSLRVTDPIRTLVDLGLTLRPAAVNGALSQALVSRLVTADQVFQLRKALGRQGRNGTGIIGELIEKRMLTASIEESVLEARLIDLLAASGLPRPSLQHEVWVGGRFVARVDAAYADQFVAIEVDGYAAHGSPDAFQRDRTRQNELVVAGWTVLRFTWHDIVREPLAVAQAIRRALSRDLRTPEAT
jgi:very-short-patch-repair endonuclease